MRPIHDRHLGKVTGQSLKEEMFALLTLGAPSAALDHAMDQQDDFFIVTIIRSQFVKLPLGFFYCKMAGASYKSWAGLGKMFCIGRERGNESFRSSLALGTTWWW